MSYKDLRPLQGEGKKIFIETYGCQMNFGDSEIVVSIMQEEGYFYTEKMEEADIILINTCSVRDNAEQRIWGRLSEMRRLRRKKPSLLVGIIGCMAERLKEEYPKLDITRYASLHDLHLTRPESYMDTFYKKARQIAKDYQRDNTHDKAFISRLFNDYDYAAKLICDYYKSSSTTGFMGNMHDLAMIVQNFDNLPELHDIFTEEERYQMWHLFNIRRYLTYGPSADYGDVRNQDAKALLRDIVVRAEDVITGKTYDLSQKDIVIEPLSSIVVELKK